MIEKPEIGAACNGCGLCCRQVICSVGAFGMRLVDRYGDRVAGPCPALTEKDGLFVCGLVLRPKDWLFGNRRGPMVLREAVKVLIGANIGCDEAGDEVDASAQAKLDVVREKFMLRHSMVEIEAAVRALNDREI